VGGKHSFFGKKLENTEFLAWKATFVQLSKNGYDDSSESLPPLSWPTHTLLEWSYAKFVFG
jgi:hypothetical protein